MKPLKKGDKSPEVKAYQQMLIDNGFLSKQYATGYYGDLTDAATKKFQAAKNLPVTGVANTTTSKALSSSATSDLLENNPSLVGTKEGDYLATIKITRPDLYYQITTGIKNGTGFNGAMIKRASEKANADTAEYYNQDRTNATATLSNYLNSASNGYSINSDQLKNQGVQDFNTLNNKEGENGTWASSARADRMNSLQNNYKSKFDELYNNTAPDIYNKLQGQEYNYGEANTPKFSLGKTSVDFTKPNADFSSTSSNIYNPFKFVGRKNAEQSAGNMAATQDYQTSQLNNPY